jgi:hypothetical protein
MSDSKDRGPSTPPPAADSKRSGRAGLDERGNSVWEWQLETGVYSRDISTQKLRKLDLGDLSIAETASHQKPWGSAPTNKPKAPGGFNPYDSAGSGNAGGNPYDNARNTAHKTQTSSPAGAPATRKPMDLKRLDEWMQIRKRLEEQKKDDDE